jgi:hypothetical protein
MTSRCCWNCARRLTCFLSGSVTRKYLQFGTWTNSLSKDTINSVLWHREVVRAKDLSAASGIIRWDIGHKEVCWSFWGTDKRIGWGYKFELNGVRGAAEDRDRRKALFNALHLLWKRFGEMKGSEVLLRHVQSVKIINTQMERIHYYWESKSCNIKITKGSRREIYHTWCHS